MNRADRIAKKKADKRARKMDRCGGQSRYARKFAWLMSHPRPEQRTIVQSDGTVANIEVQRIPWGWEIASPKPWQ